MAELLFDMVHFITAVMYLFKVTHWLVSVSDSLWEKRLLSLLPRYLKLISTTNHYSYGEIKNVLVVMKNQNL